MVSPTSVRPLPLVSCTVAVLTSVSVGRCVAFTVLEAGEDVTAPSVAVAVLATDPALRSAWVTV